MLRLGLLGLLAVVGAGLGLWAAGRTDLLTAVGIPLPGAAASTAPSVVTPTTTVSEPPGGTPPETPTPRPDLGPGPTPTPPAPVASPTPAAPPPGAVPPPAPPAPAAATPEAPPAAVVAPAPAKPPSGSATVPRAPAASQGTRTVAAATPALSKPAPASPAEGEHRSSDREKLLGAFADAQAAAEAPATVRVESTPKLRVRLGDKVLGTTPLVVTVPPPGGVVEIELFDSGLGLSRTEQLELKQGDNGVRKVIIPKGTLELKVDDGVAVAIDGKSVGTAPLDPVQLYEGRHQVQLSKGDLKERRLLEIQGGKTEVLEFSFPEDR